MSIPIFKPVRIIVLIRKLEIPEPKLLRYKDSEDIEDPMLYGMLTHGIGPDADYYAKEIAKVLSYEYCELGPDFLGFTATYRHLSMIIPLHFTVIDFGCNHACQAYYFKRHAKYIGIDSSIPVEYRLNTPNSEHFMVDGRVFINSIQGNELLSKNSPVFAISNYVPDKDLNDWINFRFKDLYIFYPKL